MGSGFPTIPIRADAAAGAPACGGCLQGANGAPVCRATQGHACEAPQLSGPADELARLLAALAPVLGPADSGLVRALRVQAGEVELQLSVPADCGGAALADSAFQALRGLLPDTDIYVMPAR